MLVKLTETKVMKVDGVDWYVVERGTVVVAVMIFAGFLPFSF